VEVIGVDVFERSLDRGVIEGLLAGLLRGLLQLQDGQLAEAHASLSEAEQAARAMGSVSGRVAARALLAELAQRRGEGVEPAGLGEPTSGGLARMLWLRARAVLGDDEARAGLAQAVEELHAPGLALA
jgi:hypothetical protein